MRCRSHHEWEHSLAVNTFIMWLFDAEVCMVCWLLYNDVIYYNKYVSAIFSLQSATSSAVWPTTIRHICCLQNIRRAAAALVWWHTHKQSQVLRMAKRMTETAAKVLVGERRVMKSTTGKYKTPEQRPAQKRNPLFWIFYLVSILFAAPQRSCEMPGNENNF